MTKLRENSKRKTCGGRISHEKGDEDVTLEKRG